MEMEQAAVHFESNKRKIETVSPATSGNDDDELKVKHARESSSSFSSESDQVSSHLIRKSRNEDEAHFFFMAELLVKQVVAYYNDEARKSKDTMEAVKIKEAIGQLETREMMYFICFDAKLTTKDGKHTTNTNCQSVLFIKKKGGGPFFQVFYIKLRSLEENHIAKWTKNCGNRRVLYSEAMEQMECASDNKEKDVDTNAVGPDDVSVRAEGFAQEAVADDNKKDEVENFHTDNDDTVDDPVRNQELAQKAVAHDNKKEEDVDNGNNVTDDDLVRAQESAQEAVADDNKKEEECDDTCDDDFKTRYSGRGINAEISPRVREFAAEAVADYNKKDGNNMMQLVEIKEAFFRTVAALEYHIIFEARLFDKDGKGSTQINCQAVVSNKFSGPITVWFLRLGPPKGTTDDWCKDCRCVCKFPPWQPPSRMELLKFTYPEWYPSSDDELEVEDKKVKPESSHQPPPGSRLIWRDREALGTERTGDR